jgi:hypothetical protein
MANDGSVTLGVADGAYPTLSAAGLAGAVADAVVSLSSAYPQLINATHLTGGSADGACNWGAPDNFNPKTPCAVGASGLQGADGDGAALLPELDAAGSLEPALAWPEYALDALVLVGEVGDGAAAAPPWQSAGALLAGTAADGAVQLAPPAVAGDTGPGADIVLALVLDGAVGLAGTLADGAAALDAPRLDALALADGSASGAAVLTPPLLAATAHATARGGGAVLLAAPALDAQLLSGTRAAATLTLAAWRLAATAVADNAATAMPGWPRRAPTASWPRAPPRCTGCWRSPPGPGPPPSTATMAFNSLAVFNGVVLAASADGIMALTGDTDNGAPIAASMTSGRLDFDTATTTSA